MAENKRTFIAHCKWIHPVSKLDDDEAGRLFKHLLAYVNGDDDDEDPVAPDRITELTFEPMKQELKAELVKWRLARDKFAKAGKASAEAKANRKKLATIDLTVPVLGPQQVETAVNNVEQPATSLKPETSKTKKARAKKKIKDIVRGPNDIVNLAPFDESFRPHWNRWIEFKRVEFGDKYKRLDTEQTQFNLMVERSERSAENAIKMINNSIAGPWKGLYALNDQHQHGKNISNNRGKQQTGTDKIGTNFDEQSL